MFELKSKLLEKKVARAKGVSIISHQNGTKIEKKHLDHFFNKKQVIFLLLVVDFEYLK